MNHSIRDEVSIFTAVVFVCVVLLLSIIIWSIRRHRDPKLHTECGSPIRRTIREVVMNFWARTIAVMIASIAGGAMSHAAELTVLASQGNPPGVNELATAFARASGHKVTVLQEVGKALEQRLSNGPADLITGNPPMMEELLKKGQLVAGTATPFMLAGLGVSVRAGAPKPDISTVEAYKKTLLAAKSIGYSRGCSGEHGAQGIAQLGLTEQLKPKIVLTAGRTAPCNLFSRRAY